MADRGDDNWIIQVSRKEFHVMRDDGNNTPVCTFTVAGDPEAGDVHMQTHGDRTVVLDKYVLAELHRWWFGEISS